MNIIKYNFLLRELKMQYHHMHFMNFSMKSLGILKTCDTDDQHAKIWLCKEFLEKDKILETLHCNINTTYSAEETSEAS